MSAPSTELLVGLSRELALVVDPAGIVRWADDRARAILGGDPTGRAFVDLAAAGTGAKNEALLADIRSGGAREWETCLSLRDTPATVTFSAAITGADILLVGRVATAHQERAVREVRDAMHAISNLHRDAERRHREVVRLNSELADSNGGLVRLHRELDDRADVVRRQNDVKSRVVANVSHEFRTPINSILGITQLLLEETDGPLNAEQVKQLRFIRGSAQSLAELVDDLLDLSRLEAGHHVLRSAKFHANDLLAALRGMMKPLVTDAAVELVVEDPAEALELETDEGKIGQILRNLVSNALKFTERGSVRVRAMRDGQDMVEFQVEDTGIGIAPEDRERVFEEFAQIEGPLQRKVRGTGLGLSVSRRLAEVLGGRLTLESEVGRGSRFRLVVPRVHDEVQTMRTLEASSASPDPLRAPVLVVEDDRQTLFLYEKFLARAGFQVFPARTVEDARRALDRIRPRAIVLDVMLEGESTWHFLSELKEDPNTRDIPVMVVTVVDHAKKARALGADEFWLKPVDGERLRRKVSELARKGAIRIVAIDDDESARYLLRKLLSGTQAELVEAASGPEGVEKVREVRPHLVLLDFVLGDITAFEVLDELKSDPSTRGVPVIVLTSKVLDAQEIARLSKETSSIINKQNVSRELAITRIREALLQAGGRQVEAGG